MATKHGAVPEGLPDYDDGDRFAIDAEFTTDDALAWLWRHHASLVFWLDADDGHESLTLYVDVRPVGAPGAPQQSQFTFIVSSPLGVAGAIQRAVSAARASTGLE